jgi:biotin carboxylase
VLAVMKQKILVPNQGMPNQFFLKSCRDRGIELDIIVDLSYVLLTDDVLKHEQVLGNKIVLNEKLNKLVITDKIKEHYQDTPLDYIYPSWFDFRIMAMAHINEKLNIPGLGLDAALKIFDKLTYQTILEKEGITLPKIISCLDPYSEQYFYNNAVFPLIAKPVKGTGSLGVKVLQSTKEATDFFKDYDTPFNSFCEKGQTGYKHYDYHCLGSCYILQEYIDGDLVSVSGHVINNKVNVDLVYDIKSSELPYRAEIGFTYPSKHNKEKLTTIIKKIIKTLEIDNSPFMMDFIYKDTTFYLIDFSARFSTSTQYIMNYLGEKDYAFNVVNKILNNVDFDIDLQNCISIRHLPIEKGKIKYINIDTTECVTAQLPETGSQHYSSRIDAYAGNKGFIVAESNDLLSLEEKVNRILKTLEVEYV